MPPNMVFTPSVRESSTLKNEETDEFSVNSGCLDGAWEKIIYIYTLLLWVCKNRYLALGIMSLYIVTLFQASV